MCARECSRRSRHAGAAAVICAQPGCRLVAAAYATKYLRLRSLSLIPALVSAVAFAAFRGMLDTVTPLKVSVASNALNLALDPVLIFLARMGVAGAALATAASETLAGLIYVALLLRRKLLTLDAL